MNILLPFIEIMLHLDQYLHHITMEYGVYIYPLLFLVIFCETGLIIFPFLPGDSLLFAAGALASGGYIKLYPLIILLILAAILGDTLNYAIGYHLSSRLFQRSHNKWFNANYLKRAEAFYEQYGAKTIMIARFIPIIRTFAPFVAGISNMRYSKFLCYNAVGAMIWVSLICSTAYWFGHVDFVKSNFSIIILAIILVSLIPVVVELLRFKFHTSKTVEK